MVAKSARGSFRDAIKILEQVILAGKPAAEVLGLLEFADPAKFIKLLRDEDTKGALEFINKMTEEGVNPRSFIERCVEELREQLIESTNQSMANVQSLLIMIGGLERAYERTKTSAVPQLPLEIFVIENTQRTGSLLVRSEDHPKRGPVADSVKHGSGKGKFKLEDARARWPDILKAVKPHNHSIEALLRSTRPVEFDGDMLMLEVFYKFHKDKLETDKCRQIVEAAVGEVFGTDPARLVLQLGQRLQPAREEVVADSVDEDIVARRRRYFRLTQFENRDTMGLWVLVMLLENWEI